ncbi:MAG: F0F1 ATP synthase subunit delta [Mycobacteriales bacterium]
MQGLSRVSLAAASERFEAEAGELDDAQLDQIFDEFHALVALLDGEPALRRSLSDPALPAPAKVNLARALFGSRLSAPGLRIFEAVLAGRWSRSADLSDAVAGLASSAAFLVAERAGALDEVEDQLFRFGRIIDAQSDLWAALSNPQLPVARKRDLVRSLLEGKVASTTLRLVDAVVRQPRGRPVDEAVEELARLAAARQSRLIAEVRVAVALTEDEQRRLAQRLADIYDHPVHLQIEIDPDVIGGFLVSVGGEVIDATVASRLAGAARRLAG